MPNYEPLLVQLNAEEFAIVTRDVHAENFGGAQRTLVKVLQQLSRTERQVRLARTDIVTIKRNAEKLTGGYAARYQALATAIARAEALEELGI